MLADQQEKQSTNEGRERPAPQLMRFLNFFAASGKIFRRNSYSRYRQKINYGEK